MKKIIPLFALFLAFTSVLSQETTTGLSLDTLLSYKQKVLVIPFESNMYLSDIDKDLALKEHMTYQEIKKKFRTSLDQNIVIQLYGFFTPISLFDSDTQEPKQEEQAYIYNSISFKYEVMPLDEEKKKGFRLNKLKNKFKKKEKYIEAGVSNGEIVSQADNREKYMNTVAKNNLFPYFNKQYQANYYIFINELDVKRSLNEAYQETGEMYIREIKVHYTIFDNVGAEINSGAIKEEFSSTLNDINEIVKIHFPIVAQKIVSKLPGVDIATVK